MDIGHFERLVKAAEKLAEAFSVRVAPKEEPAAEIPNIKDIQYLVMRGKLQTLNTKLSMDGRAQLTTSGLIAESIDDILSRVVKAGYQVWKYKGPRGAMSAEYWIETQSCHYVEEYCENITDSIRAKAI